MRQSKSADDEKKMTPVSQQPARPHVFDGFCAVTLNIGGRNTNPAEFVLEGDESDLGVACTALGVQLLDAMGSDTLGPSSLSEAERSAVDAVLAEVGSVESPPDFFFFVEVGSQTSDNKKEEGRLTS